MLMISFALFAFKWHAAADVYIELQNQRLPITPKEFYIASVDDERADDLIIGKVLPAVSAVGKAVFPLKIDLKGGIAAVKNFVSYSLPVNKTLRPVIIKIKELNVSETAGTNNRVQGRVKLVLVFGLMRYDDFITLGSYTGGSNYQRSAGPAQQIEPMLRNALSNSLTYLNTWMNQQAGSNIQLAKSVAVTFTDQTEQLDDDTIYYNVNRPLKWTDFREKPQRGSRHGAEVFTSIGYDEDAKLTDGVVHVKLNMKVFTPKSACWVNYDAINGYALNHEQRHFDIARLVAEHFKQKINTKPLLPQEYDAVINIEYLETLRELTALQTKYDAETAHSINSYEQQQWNTRIENELQQLGIKSVAN